MVKHILSLFLSSFVLTSCSSGLLERENKFMYLHLGESSYAELVDFLYEFARKHRLTVLWFGAYEVENPTHWYEYAKEALDDPEYGGFRGFKIKLELLTEENGYLFINDYFDEKIAATVIDYGDEKAVWLEIVDEFKYALVDRGWRLEDISDAKTENRVGST